MTKELAKSISDATLNLLREGGNGSYFGEQVTQLQHALQAADLARSNGADDEMILAALLHDIGHLLEGERHEEVGVIDHDQCGASWLEDRSFGERLIELVSGHVHAKRYLVATRPEYRDRLSEASQQTLVLQGGPMTPEEGPEFEERPRFREILRVRSWDEQAKNPDAIVPSLESYRSILLEYLERQDTLDRSSSPDAHRVY